MAAEGIHVGLVNYALNTKGVALGLPLHADRFPQCLAREYPMDFELLYKDSMLLPLGATAVRRRKIAAVVISTTYAGAAVGLAGAGVEHCLPVRGSSARDD